MNDAPLRAVGLAKRFRAPGGDLAIFENLDLEVARGEMLAIIGESGAGKTTLLQILGALDAPSRGDVHINGKAVSQMTEEQLADLRNQEIGFVWQFHYLLPELTALENTGLPLRLRGGEDVERRARELLREVGLAERAEHRPGQLSGGEQQRVALARALANRPAVLLADEPTGNLDARTAAKTFDLIRELHATHGLTSVIVTHNLALARRCDRVLEMREGRLAATARGSDGA